MAKIKKPPAKKGAPVKGAATSTAVARLAPVEQTKAVTAKTVLDHLLAQDAGSGMEGMNKDDFAIPRLAILQELSPQVKPRDPLYIEGAEVGMILDNVTNDVYDGQEGILVVIVSYRRTHLQWWPRNSSKGKGFIADHGLNFDMTKTTRSDRGENMLPDGSEIVPTAEYFGFLITDEQTGDYNRVLIPMAKTQLSKAKRLNTIATSIMVEVAGKQVQAPFFIRAYRLKTGPQQNKKGQEWIGWEIEPAQALLPGKLAPEIEVLPYGERLYMDARNFKQAISENKVQVAKPVETDTGHGTEGATDDAPM